MYNETGQTDYRSVEDIQTTLTIRRVLLDTLSAKKMNENAFKMSSIEKNIRDMYTGVFINIIRSIVNKRNCKCSPPRLKKKKTKRSNLCNN